MVGQKKEATQCDPMGVSQKNKACVWNKSQTVVGGNDHKNSTLTCKGTIYNGLENTYVCRNITRAPTTETKNNRGKFCSC